MSAAPRGTALDASPWRRIMARLGIDLHPGEGRIAVLLFLAFFLFITYQYAAKSVRESTFISSLGAARLPYVYFFVAACSYPFLRLYARLADRVSRHHLIAATCAVIAGSMVLFWWLFEFPWTWIPFVFYVWVSIAFVMTVSQFWSFANHVLDPRQGKRLFGFVGAGGLLGGIAGGQVAKLATNLVGTRYSLLVAAAILGVAVVIVYAVHRMKPEREAEGAGAAGLGKLEAARGGFAVIRESRHLQLVAAIMVLTVMVAQVVDLQFKWAAEQATTSLDQRTAFFGNFYSVMGILAFVFQLIFTARIHRTLGVGFAMRILPVTMALGTGLLFGAATAFPAFLIGAALVLKVGENGLRYSLDQATRELLFLPVPSRARIKAKAFIDVFVQRGAKGLAAITLLPVTFGLITAVEAGWISWALIVVWLGATVAMYREYVRSFRSGLKQRTMDTAVPINLSDVATLEILVQSLGSSDPRQVLHSLELLASHGRGNLVPPLLLYHDDPEVRRRTLEILATAGREDAAPLIERRLGDQDPDVRAEAIRVLAGFHGQDVCALMLPRLRETDAGVRAAAVACLANHGEADMVGEATAALRDLLSDADPEVRAEGAKAVGAIREPLFRQELVRLLYDADPQVVRHAIAAVRRRVAREGYNPLYVPTLISLLQARRLKHEARDGLVAFGESVIPALVHFMNDPDEPLWVRRALPKTVARIGTAAAAQALVDSLSKPADVFQRHKLIEALGGLRDHLAELEAEGRIAEEIEREAAGHSAVLRDLWALGLAEKGRLDGPRVRWESETLDPSFLERLLAERLDDHLENIFGLLSQLHPPHDVWAAYRSLLAASPLLRTHALEYLDNTLVGDVRRCVFAVIDDKPLADRFAQFERLFGVEQQPRTEVLRRLVTAPLAAADGGAAALSAAALYTIYTERVSELYGEVERVATETDQGFLQETAVWIARRVNPEREERLSHG